MIWLRLPGTSWLPLTCLSLGEVLFGAVLLGAVEPAGSTSENESMLPGPQPEPATEGEPDEGPCKVEARSNNICRRVAELLGVLPFLAPDLFFDGYFDILFV